MSDDDLRFVVKFPDKCCAEVSRNGQSQPCDKPAVAVAHGDTDGWRCGSDSWWPVCPHHTRGRRMVLLADLIDSLT